MLSKKLQQFIENNINDLTVEQTVELLRINLEPKQRRVAQLRRTVTKPVLVEGTTYMRNGKKVTRKAYRRAKPKPK